MRARPHRAFRTGELALALLLIVGLVAFVLARFGDYRTQAERVAVRHMVAALRMAMQAESARGGMRALAGSNPMRWLEPAPVNYLGERYRPDIAELPEGNWVFDLRDKTLVYIAFSDKNFTFGESTLLKFKVELTGSSDASGSPGRDGASVGLALHQVGGAPP
jgi:hypothetical protein